MTSAEIPQFLDIGEDYGNAMNEDDDDLSAEQQALIVELAERGLP